MNGNFTKTLESFVSVHKTDPSLSISDSSLTASETYHARLVDYVKLLSYPGSASEGLLLAACSQHIKRYLLKWTVPRNSYPDGLAGYKKWRAGLNKLHANEATKIMQECGYDPENDSGLFRQ
ncbi:hypothetical protein HK096_008426, partial [Nowakowskiella sp. JEL0078]